MKEEKRYSLTYDLGMYNDNTIVEEFDTIKELLERYYEIEYDFCEFEAWDGDKKIAPWL